VSEETRRSAISRYWPVLLVVVVAAGVLAVGAQGGDDDDTGRSGTTPTSTDSGSGVAGPPALAFFEGEDPLSAPDCDPDTGRLMIPMVYAPNCVPLWEEGRDNGGGTHAGVTATEITIAIYQAQDNAEASAAVADATGQEALPAAETEANRQQVFDVMNALWETYGRTVTFEMLRASGSASDDAAAKADAIRAATEIGAFAVIGGPTGTKAFAEELAARRLVCICADSYPAERYVEWAPYVYGSGISSTWRNTFMADLLVSLAGQPAEHAGDALVGTERRFGLVHYETVDEVYKTAAEALVRDAAAEGIEIMRLPYVLDLATAQENARTMVARMKSGGVTSVILSGDPFMPYFVTNEATSQDWYPEWIMSGAGLVDTAVAGRSYDQAQWRHAFGLSTLLARIDPAAVQDDDNFVAWHLGRTLTSYPSIISAPTLFTGIQLAGPHLTPETFRDGLFSFERTSGYVTNWGVSWGTELWPMPDYTGADDVTLIWWDPDAEGPHETQDEGQSGLGMWRYVDGGKRYARGELAGVDPVFFDTAGTSLLLAERPEADRVPDYPRRASRRG